MIRFYAGVPQDRAGGGRNEDAGLVRHHRVFLLLRSEVHPHKTIDELAKIVVDTLADNGML